MFIDCKPGASQSRIEVGPDQPLLVIAGPCVIESRDLVFEIAERLITLTRAAGVSYIFKASFDKANRSSVNSFRGHGMEQGLAVLEAVRNELGCPVLTDVHEDTPIDEVASVVDVMQTPAFLVRQTNFMLRVARAGIAVNVKKGQFQAPWDMPSVIEKFRSVGNDQMMICERGTSFGYNTLISDMRGLALMRQYQQPVIFDCTHSVQQPGGLGSSSGGQREFVPVLARAAAAAGVSGLFVETHPDPDQALSDGPNMLPLQLFEPFLESVVAIHETIRSHARLEDQLMNAGDQQ